MCSRYYNNNNCAPYTCLNRKCDIYSICSFYFSFSIQSCRSCYATQERQLWIENVYFSVYIWTLHNKFHLRNWRMRGSKGANWRMRGSKGAIHFSALLTYTRIMTKAVLHTYLNGNCVIYSLYRFYFSFKGKSSCKCHLENWRISGSKGAITYPAMAYIYVL